MGTWNGQRLGTPAGDGPPPPTRRQLDEAQAALYDLTRADGPYVGLRKYVDLLIVASMKGVQP